MRAAALIYSVVQVNLGKLGLARTGFRSAAFMSLVNKCVLKFVVWESI